MGRFCELLIVVALFLQKNAEGVPVVNLSSLIHASIDVNTLTVSGFSSGGAMANVMHFAFSSKVKGGGVFAGLPFNIAYNLSHRNFIPKYAVTLVISMLGRSQIELQTNIESLAEKGIIDPVSGLVGSKSYVYEGSLDPIIFKFTGLPRKVVNTYKYFGSDVKLLNLSYGGHCVPTDNYGSPCPIANPLDDGLKNCGIESIFEMFKHFYGKEYKQPTSSSTPYTGTLYNFDQSPYSPSGNAARDFMNGHGGIYIPLACRDANATCKLHAAFHGCTQSMYTNVFYDKWAVHAGYLQVADTNHIIVVFPRTAVFELQSNFKSNVACWDFFGGTTTLAVPFKEMPQVKSVANILNGIIGTKFLD